MRATAFVIGIIFALSVFGGEEVVEPKALTAARLQYQKALERAEAPIKAKYVEELKALQTELARMGRLEEALLVKAEAETLTSTDGEKPVVAVGKRVLRVKLIIDGKDKLILSRSSLAYQHFESAVATGATVNGHSWSLTKPYEIKPSIDMRHATAKKLMGRAAMQSESVGDTLVVTIADNERGTDIYEIEFTW